LTWLLKAAEKAGICLDHSTINNSVNPRIVRVCSANKGSSIKSSQFLEAEVLRLASNRLSNDQVIKEADLQDPRAGLKKGVWGESGLAFESIVEEVRRFVARMPPVDSTTGSVCCLWSFSAP